MRIIEYILNYQILKTWEYKVHLYWTVRTVYLEQFAGCESPALTGTGTETDQLEALYLENFIQVTICYFHFILNENFIMYWSNETGWTMSSSEFSLNFEKYALNKSFLLRSWWRLLLIKSINIQYSVNK